MNGIDAIIALSALTAGFGILLGALNEIKKNEESAIETIKAKENALQCAGIIDSIIANSAKSYASEINCQIQGESTSATINSKTKTAQIIGKTKKNIIAEIETKKHYLE